MKDIMEEIRIITNKGELEGTCYMEVLPGPYREQCWNEGSLFFEEEVFGYLEPIIKRHVETYDHYAFTEIEKEQWLAIVNDFDKLELQLISSKSISDLQNQVSFIFKRGDERFSSNFDINKTALSQLVAEFSKWIRAKTNEHDSITILGM
jgi:hypothetical protein